MCEYVAVPEDEAERTSQISRRELNALFELLDVEVVDVEIYDFGANFILLVVHCQVWLP